MKVSRVLIARNLNNLNNNPSPIKEIQFYKVKFNFFFIENSNKNEILIKRTNGKLKVMQ